MDELLIHLRDITSPIINSYDVELKDLVFYTINILKCIYEKKFVKKQIYKEFIKQLICSMYIETFGHIYNNFEVEDHTETVNYLKTIPQFEQRTKEWFDFRKNNIGASEGAIIFGKSIFSNGKKLLLKKCGYSEPFVTNPACQHGTKYEPVIQLLYQNKNNTVLYEFGSIAHPDYPMISASPDGITETGVMIEIKAPFRRKITSIPPVYYWYQMQQQLQVCNLDRVDFVECKIEEYLNKKQYLKDYNPEVGEDCNINGDGNMKGIIIEYFIHTGILSSVDWIYPEKFLSVSEIPDWIEIQKNKLEIEDKTFSRAIYYRVDKYSCCGVWRDDAWWDTNKHKYLEFWNTVVEQRKKGFESLIKKKKPRQRRKVKCLIED